MATGVLGAFWMLGMVLIGGATFAGYDHASQFISELGANGAPQGFAMSWFGFLPTGILTCAFALFAWLAAPRSALSTLGFFGVLLFAIGYVGAAFFRCDFGCRPDEPSASQMMHNLFGVTGYLFAPLSLLFLGLAARKWPGASGVSALGFVGAALSVAALAVFSPDFAYVGIAQRALEASMLGWIVACALYLGRLKH